MFAATVASAERSSGVQGILRPDGDDVVGHEGIGLHLGDGPVRGGGRLTFGQKRAQHIQLGDESHHIAPIVRHRKGIEVVAIEQGQQLGDGCLR